jgi:hypothetical protein
MRKRAIIGNLDPDKRLLVDTAGLQQITDCGREAATKIGMAAGARVKVGRRVLWNVEKVREYLKGISA